MVFPIVVSLLILQRIAELIISKRNEKWLLKHGAIEYGQAHYPFIVALHILFFVSLISEYIWKKEFVVNDALLALLILLMILRIWVIHSLGKFWNTKIFHVPGMPLINKGPYRLIKHPNYIIVEVEIAVIPLIFHLYYTAIVFSLLNAIVLSVRIKEENKILQ